eukprot:g13242.t1 g13242   contig8:238963-240183(-)
MKHLPRSTLLTAASVSASVFLAPATTLAFTSSSHRQTDAFPHTIRPAALCSAMSTDSRALPVSQITPLDAGVRWTEAFQDDTLSNNGATTSSSSPSKRATLSRSITPSNIQHADMILKIIQWSSWALSRLTSISTSSFISPLFRNAFLNIMMARYTLRIYSFTQSIEDYRQVYRTQRETPSYHWSSTTHPIDTDNNNNNNTWDNPLIAKLTHLMAFSMLFYYPLEHIALCAWQLPQLAPPSLQLVSTQRMMDTGNLFSAVSCRFWVVYVLGDLGGNSLKWRELRRKVERLDGVVVGGLHHRFNQLQQQQYDFLQGRLRHIKIQTLRSLLFLLPAINWSLSKWATDPLFNELIVNGLMLVEAYTCVYQSLTEHKKRRWSVSSLREWGRGLLFDGKGGGQVEKRLCDV